MFRRRNPRYFRVGQGPRKPKIGEAVINTITPDRAEVKVGGPAPIPEGKLVWDREKKLRIARLRNRFLR